MQLDTDRLNDEVFAEQLGDILDAVADRPYPTPKRRAIARQTVALTVTAYGPRNPVETTMAGHCVIYDNLLRHVAGTLLCGEDEQQTLKTLPGILNCGKMYLATLTMLNSVQGRAPDRAAFARPMPEREAAVAPDVAAARPDLAAARRQPTEGEAPIGMAPVADEMHDQPVSRSVPSAPHQGAETASSAAPEPAPEPVIEPGPEASRRTTAMPSESQVAPDGSEPPSEPASMASAHVTREDFTSAAQALRGVAPDPRAPRQSDDISWEDVEGRTKQRVEDLVPA